jgi:long-subunit fatty acid transport protein
MILSEMDNDLKKYSIQTTVGFENNNMDDQGLGLQFQPTKIEFQNHFEKLLADMQTVTEEV